MNAKASAIAAPDRPRPLWARLTAEQASKAMQSMHFVRPALLSFRICHTEETLNFIFLAIVTSSFQVNTLSFPLASLISRRSRLELELKA